MQVLIYEYKLDATPAQYVAMDEAIRVVQFIRNKCLRLWMDGRSISSNDLQCYCSQLAKQFPVFQAGKCQIIPLTIFGDRSASAIRKLLKTPPFSPDAAIRFYRGDILFPGVDQACWYCAHHTFTTHHLYHAKMRPGDKLKVGCCPILSPLLVG